jgi:hypothetical protein
MEERKLTWRHAGQKSPPPHFPRVGRFYILLTVRRILSRLKSKAGWVATRNVERRTETRELTHFRIFNSRVNAFAA